MVVQTGKHYSNFMAIFDNLLPLEWCHRIYQYALTLGRPWGAYVTTEEVLDSALDIDALWLKDQEKAMSLIVVRSLFFGKGKHFLEGDINCIHGNSYFQRILNVILNRNCCVVSCIWKGKFSGISY